MSSNPALGRPADRMNHIVRELRGEIVAGMLRPGHQLPTRVEIEQRFGASTTTVQRALEYLRRDGFVEVNGRQGTFVSPYPPHLTRYGIVFPNAPSDPGWARFWSALQNEAVRLERKAQDRPLRLPAYFGLDGRTDTPDYLQLLEDVQSHRLAGLIFPTSTHKLDKTALLRESTIPRVVIISGRPDLQTALVHLDGESFRAKALGYLVSRSRCRIAVISLSHDPIWMDEWRNSAAGFGLELPAYWQQGVHVANSYAAKNLVQLLMRGSGDQRPDGLVITDDNLVEHAIAGLVAAGIRVPEDLEVVAHCNFPWPVPSALPVRRLGFDSRDILQTCIASVDRQISGDRQPTDDIIPAVFEDEIQ